jgi:hypothetical protein
LPSHLRLSDRGRVSVATRIGWKLSIERVEATAIPDDSDVFIATIDEGIVLVVKADYHRLTNRSERNDIVPRIIYSVRVDEPWGDVEAAPRSRTP